jgi:hypothetical protein
MLRFQGVTFLFHQTTFISIPYPQLQKLHLVAGTFRSRRHFRYICRSHRQLHSVVGNPVATTPRFAGTTYKYTSWGIRRCQWWAIAKPDSIFSYMTKKTEKFVDMCHCKMCAMLPTKGSSTYGGGKKTHTHTQTHVQEKEYSIVNEYNVLYN